MICYDFGMEKKHSREALADHIRAKGMKKREYAAQVGVREDQLSRWLNGRVRPERGMRLYIETITEGAVPAEGWQ